MPYKEILLELPYLYQQLFLGFCESRVWNSTFFEPDSEYTFTMKVPKASQEGETDWVTFCTAKLRESESERRRMNLAQLFYKEAGEVKSTIV